MDIYCRVESVTHILSGLYYAGDIVVDADNDLHLNDMLQVAGECSRK